MPDGGGEGQDALQDVDGGPVDEAAAVLFEVESLVVIGLRQVRE
jgi:hypothetical protein